MGQAHQRAVGRCKPPWKQMQINFTLEVGKAQPAGWLHNQWSRLDLKQLTKRQEQCMVYLGSHQILHLNICTMREFQLDMRQQCISCTMFILGLLGWQAQPLSPTFQIKERFSNIPQHINNIYGTHRITDNSNTITATISTTLTIMSIKIIPWVLNHRLSHHNKKSSQQLGLLIVDA